jgi:hypothetical protein
MWLSLFPPCRTLGGFSPFDPPCITLWGSRNGETLKKLPDFIRHRAHSHGTGLGRSEVINTDLNTFPCLQLLCLSRYSLLISSILGYHLLVFSGRIA